MICKTITLQNFRNVAEASVSFCDGINLVLGDNAQGKTNLLEAIALIALGKSFRGAKEAEMIRFGEQACHVELTYEDSVRQQTAAVRMDQSRRREWMQNGSKVRRVADMVGQFRVVIFQPEHLSLIKSGPEMRRNFLDVALCQLKPMYLRALQRYNGILKQRNLLLRQAKEQGGSLIQLTPLLDVWTQQLAQEAATVAHYRADFVKQMSVSAVAVFREMTDGAETPGFAYKGPLGYGEENHAPDAAARIMERMQQSYAAELGAGVTLHGTHRDDIDITLNGKSARLFASQGQQRSLSLAMKLAEGEISRETYGDYPVFLFDDVLSELDRNRREYLISRIRDKQVILSGCEHIGALSDGDGETYHVISVREGRFRSGS